MRKIERCWNKRAISNVLAYVLLIAFTISLTFMVYAWMKSFGEIDVVENCPVNTELILDSYTCILGEEGGVRLELKNKGMFDIDGFVLRAHNRSDAEFGFYDLNETGAFLESGETWEETFYFWEVGLNDVSLLDVQPFVLSEGGERLLCESFVTRDINCVEEFVFDELIKDGNVFKNESGAGVATCFNDHCRLRYLFANLTLPVFDVPYLEVYNVTFEFRSNAGNVWDYRVYCGSSVFDFVDGWYDGVDYARGSVVNVSLPCRFFPGDNNITFATTDGTVGGPLSFGFLTVEGPALI